MVISGGLRATPVVYRANGTAGPSGAEDTVELGGRPVEPLITPGVFAPSGPKPLEELEKQISAGALPVDRRLLEEQLLPHLLGAPDQGAATGLVRYAWSQDPTLVEPTMTALAEHAMEQPLKWEQQYCFEVAAERYGWQPPDTVLQWSARSLLTASRGELPFHLGILNSTPRGKELMRGEGLSLQIVDRLVQGREGEQPFERGPAPLLRVTPPGVPDELTGQVLELFRDDPAVARHLLGKALGALCLPDLDGLDMSGKLYLALADQFEENREPLTEALMPFTGQRQGKGEFMFPDDVLLAQQVERARRRRLARGLERLPEHPDKLTLARELLGVHHQRQHSSGMDPEYYSRQIVEKLFAEGVKPRTREWMAELESEYRQGGGLAGLGPGGHASLHLLEYLSRSDPELDRSLRRLVLPDLFSPDGPEYGVASRLRDREIQGAAQVLRLEPMSPAEQADALARCRRLIGGLPYSQQKPLLDQVEAAWLAGMKRHAPEPVKDLALHFQDPAKALQVFSRVPEEQTARFLEVMDRAGGEAGLEDVWSVFSGAVARSEQGTSWEEAVKQGLQELLPLPAPTPPPLDIVDDGFEVWIGSALLEPRET